jgi:hypothetical protein
VHETDYLHKPVGTLEPRYAHYAVRLVGLEGEDLGGDASPLEHLDLDAVAGVDVALGGRDEDVLHDGHHLLRGQRLLLVQTVLVANLRNIGAQ